MIVAPAPPSERERLELLERLKILDTPREERFDRLTRLASHVLDTPISAISLVARDRQWFKAAEGLEVSETPRDVAFCAHTILGEEALVVEDARYDKRFVDNPLVTGDFSLRFYAAQPIRVEGVPLGALCVIDTQPRSLTDAQLQMLGDLRDLAERELLFDDLRELQHKVEQTRRANSLLQHDMSQFFSLPIELLCILEPDGRFKRASHAWTDVLGWNEHQLLGKPITEFAHPDDAERARAEWGLVADGGRTESFELRVLSRDGTYRWLSFNAAGSASEQAIYATARDVSELKRMQSLKSEFVSTVSHELRTPMTSLCGSLDLIAEGVTGTLPTEAAELLDLARRNGRRLRRLIDDILDMEKIEAGKLSFELSEHSIAERVGRAVQEVTQFARDRSVAIDFTPPATDLRVSIDPDRLHQVLVNLLSNAVKFEPEQGRVEVAITRSAERVRVNVSDHGPGIPDSFRGRIFDKFTQADGSDRREKGGSGLGLSIAKAIVEQLGGSIGFDTVAGEGTTFFFDLPIHAERELPAADARSAPRVLVATSGEAAAAYLSGLLGDAGLAADVVDDIAAARRQLDEHDYGAVVTEALLADGDGYSLIHGMRRHAATRSIPTLVVEVGLDDDGRPCRGGALEVIDWLGLPLDRKRLYDAAGSVRCADAARSKILHVDPFAVLHGEIADSLAPFGAVVPARTLDQARRLLSRDPFSLAVVCWSMPDGSCRELIPLLQQHHVPVIWLAAESPTAIARETGAALASASRDDNAFRARLLAMIDSRLPVAVAAR